MMMSKEIFWFCHTIFHMRLHETSLFAIKLIDFPDFNESVTNGPTDGRTDRRTDGRTDPHIEMRGRI